jgi:hypothetical protein
MAWLSDKSKPFLDLIKEIHPDYKVEETPSRVLVYCGVKNAIRIKNAYDTLMDFDPFWCAMVTRDMDKIGVLEFH